MMPVSNKTETGITTLSISINDVQPGNTIEIVSALIQKDTYRSAQCEIVLLIKDVEAYIYEGHKLFSLGNEIYVHVLRGTDKLIYFGNVASQSLDFSTEGTFLSVNLQEGFIGEGEDGIIITRDAVHSFKGSVWAMPTVPGKETPTFGTESKISFGGNASAVAGKDIHLKGFGNYFDGKTMCSDVAHKIIAGCWTTSITISSITNTSLLNDNTHQYVRNFTEYDTMGLITFNTEDGNSIEINKNEHSIQLKDVNNNILRLSRDGILIESSNGIELKAYSGNIKINGDAISLDARNQLSLAAATIDAEAAVSFKAKGNATAELSASAQMIIKGAMVMIN